MSYSTAELLASIKRNQTIAASSFRFDDTDLLAMADEEIQDVIIPMILRLHSDRLLYTEVQQVVANKKSYTMPYRAIGGQLRELFFQDDLLNPTLTRDLRLYDYTYGVQVTTPGNPLGFYFSSNTVNLVPTPNSNYGYLNFTYPIQHNSLVLSSAVAVVQSVDFITGEVTLTGLPPSTFSASVYCDFIQANPRCNPRILSFDKQILGINNQILSFNSSDIPDELVAGDRVTLAGQTDTLLLPDECYKYLSKAIELKIIEAQKDLQAYTAFKPQLNELRRIMENILTPRITGEPKIIINRNGFLNRRMRRKVLPNITIS
jgi:hypothetical protein